jgi:hypothetical protein
VRFETTPRFDADYASLPVAHRRLFRALVPAFSEACDDYARDPGGFRWPARLRVRRLVGAPRVWELTWSFASPDGRATFEFISDHDGTLVRWRRIGTHRVFTDP